MDNSLVTKTIHLGDSQVTLTLPYAHTAKDSIYSIVFFSGKGMTKDCASKDFSNKVYSYARKNRLNFMFFEPGIEAKIVTNKVNPYTGPSSGIGPHIYKGSVLFMEEMPLEISREEYKNFRGRIPIRSFLEILAQRGAGLKEKG